MDKETEYKCECCGKDGEHPENFCDDCIIIEYGDESIQAKRRCIGKWYPIIELNKKQ